MNNPTNRESKMKIWSICVLSLFSCLALFGCSPEQKSVTPPVKEQAAISLADREKIRLLVKELQMVAGLSDKMFAILGQEAKSLVTGEKKSVDLAALVDKTKNELLAAGKEMAAKSLPSGIPAGIKQDLQEAKDGLIKAGQLKSESLEVMKRLVEEKRPTILLEYRTKVSAAAKQLDEAMVKLKQVQTAAGI